MIISLREIPNCFAIWKGGAETLPYGDAVKSVHRRRKSVISLREIPNCFAIWKGGSETLPYGGAVIS